jgi:hypothetical protein
MTDLPRASGLRRWTARLVLVSLSLLLKISTLLPARAGSTNLVWHWSNPLPHGNNVSDLAYQPNRYVQVGDRGQLYTSTDGRNWLQYDSGTRKSLRGVAFFGTNLVISAESGTILEGPAPDALTLHDLGTADWLESIAASSSVIVAVGDHAAIYRSTNAVHWTRQSPQFSDWLRGVAVSKDGSLFATVGENGLIATSSDGRTWNKRNSPTAANLNRVIWAGNGFLAMGDGGIVVRSGPGGANWNTESGVGATGALYAGVWDANSGRLAAGESEVRRFETLFWVDEINKSGGAPRSTYLSGIWNGTGYLLGGRTGLTVSGSRSNPNNPSSPFVWTSIPSPSRDWLWDLTTTTAYATNITAALSGSTVAYSTNRTTNTFYVAAGDYATLLNSDDGAAWITALAPASATNTIYLGLGGNSRAMVAAGSRGTISMSPVAYEPWVTTNKFTNGADVVTVVITNHLNTLGFAWQAATSPTSNDLQGVCATEDLFVVTGDGGTVLTSPDATNWTLRPTPVSRFLSCVEPFPGGFVAVGDLGALLTSTDAHVWQDRSRDTTNWIYRVRWLGGQLVAVGQNGLLFTSPDGATWTPRNTGTTRWLNDLEYIDGTYYVVGTQGAVLASNDAVTWADLGTITGKSLYGAASVGGQLVVAGVEGVILRTRAGPFPLPVTFLKYPRQSTENLFLFSGSMDQRFTLDRSTNIVDWSTGPLLEITDPEGLLLLLDDTPNDSERQYFRAKPQ